MNFHAARSRASHALPRAIGECHVAASKPDRDRNTGLADLRMSGCLKVLFSRNPARLDAIMINTAGGLTSGDRLRACVVAQKGSNIALTTQAAERAYRANDGHAELQTKLRVETAASLFWLPQELILFQGASLQRHLQCDLAANTRFLMVEPIVFGRHAMGETLTELHFQDRIEIDRCGQPLYRDALRFEGNLDQFLKRRAVADGAGAMASVVYVAQDAEAKHEKLLTELPNSVGASLLQPDMLVLRLLTADGLALRRVLLPILDCLTGNTLPTSWRL